MPEYARICQNYARVCQSMPSPLIHGIITEMCDIIIYKRGSTGGRTLESSVTNGGPDPLRPRIQKIKKMRYQRNVKIFIFTFLCLLIGMTEQKLVALTSVEIQRL